MKASIVDSKQSLITVLRTYFIYNDYLCVAYSKVTKNNQQEKEGGFYALIVRLFSMSTMFR
jgi:hypothetical protein